MTGVKDHNSRTQLFNWLSGLYAIYIVWFLKLFLCALCRLLAVTDIQIKHVYRTVRDIRGRIVIPKDERL